MLLSAILLATAVQAGPPPLADILARGAPVVVRVINHASQDEALRALKATQACRAAGYQMADGPKPDAKPKVQRLGDLPPANHTLTVLRSVDGCPVSSTIRYNVDRPVGR